MPMISFLKKLFFKETPKVMFTVPGEIPWKEINRANLNEFMRGETGMALLSQLKSDLYFSQAQACVPSDKISAQERCAIAHGKQLLISFFTRLYSIEEKEPEYTLLTDEQINEILNNRINGVGSKEFVL